MVFKGRVDKLTHLSVFGWVFWESHNEPAEVRVKLGSFILAQGTADKSRPDVGKKFSTSGQHGFQLSFPEVPKEKLSQITVEIKSGNGWKPMQIEESAFKEKTRSYQDFEGEGKSSSRSYEKLKAIRLESLGWNKAQKPLQGMSVLDLGCNEGFFCMQALKLGAERVVGIDRKKSCIKSSRKRCPEGEFLHGSWWDLPSERFDIILFLSAIHYESEQKALFKKLKRHLTPNGHLVLECGVFINPGVRSWHAVTRRDGLFKYPTQELLVYDLLSEFAVRRKGPSVKQRGDPVSRYVWHCSPKKPSVILITGRSKSGKSNLSFDLNKRDLPVYKTDTLLSDLVRGRKLPEWMISKTLNNRFNDNPLNLAKVALYLIEQGFVEEFCDAIVAESPLEAMLCVIEGEALRYPGIQKALLKKLKAAGAKVWIMRPAAEVV